MGMGKGRTINLKLTKAPLLLAAYFYGAATKIVINWPKTLEFIDVKLKDAKLRQVTDDKLSWIARQYKVLNKQPETQRFAQHVVPYNAKVDLNIEASAADLTATALRLSSIQLDYAKVLSESLFRSLGLKPQRAQLVSTSATWTKESNPIRILSAEPLNELELGTLNYYQGQQLPWGASVADWLKTSYEQKVDYFKLAVVSGPGVKYRIELVTEPARANSLARLSGFKLISQQAPQLNLGYELPPKLNDGGMMERCFDMSYGLYAQVHDEQPALAQLVCLWGHRQRVVAELGWSELANLNKISGVHSRFAKAILAKVAEKHPLVVESLGQPGKK